ncbi:MAG: hypothetical protein ACR2FY_22340 [Pirellulaceae bacterium]
MMALNQQEQRLVDLFRKLPADAAREVEDFTAFVAARRLPWSYKDPASVERSLDLMLGDAVAMGEFKAISQEFEAAEGDGLETY